MKTAWVREGMMILRDYFGLLVTRIAQTISLRVGWAAIVVMPVWMAVGSYVDPAHENKTRMRAASLQFSSTDTLLYQDPALRERAFMEAIALAEGNADYNELYGHEVIHDLTRHPNRCKPVRATGYEQLCTTAAGRWQITADTWEEYAKRLKVRDFGPAAQYQVAVAIARDTGALALLYRGNVRGAMRAASERWASLPGSTADQRRITEAQFLMFYEQSLMAEVESRQFQASY